MLSHFQLGNGGTYILYLDSFFLLIYYFILYITTQMGETYILLCHRGKDQKIIEFLYGALIVVYVCNVGVFLLLF